LKNYKNSIICKTSETKETQNQEMSDVIDRLEDMISIYFDPDALADAVQIRKRGDPRPNGIQVFPTREENMIPTGIQTIIHVEIVCGKNILPHRLLGMTWPGVGNHVIIDDGKEGGIHIQARESVGFGRGLTIMMVRVGAIGGRMEPLPETIRIIGGASSPQEEKQRKRADEVLIQSNVVIRRGTNNHGFEAWSWSSDNRHPTSATDPSAKRIAANGL
jgi:hypothetical protein